MAPTNRNLTLAISVLVLFGLGGLLAWSRSTSSSRPSATSAGSALVGPGERATVAALGRLEPGGGVIAVGGTAGERVQRLTVSEGDQVKAGQELAFLGSYALRLSERQLAEIQLSEATARGKAEQVYGAALVAEAQAALEQLKLADLDAQALAAKIDSLELNLRVATRDLERVAGAGNVVSPQEQDHQQLVVEQAKAELNSAARN